MIFFLVRNYLVYNLRFLMLNLESSVLKFQDFSVTDVFYVKSILENLEVLKMPFFHFRGSKFC